MLRRIVCLAMCINVSLGMVTYQDTDCSQFQSLKAKRLCRQKQEDQKFLSLNSIEEPEREKENLLETVTEDLGLTASTTPTTPREGPIIYTVPPPATTVDFFAEQLPECETIPELERVEGVNCRVTIVQEPEIRWRDQVFEKLLPQIWDDYQRRMRFDRELYGTELEPFKFGNYELNQSEPSYEIFLKMKDIEIHGLSTIYLDETLVTRSESLDDMDMKMAFKFESLRINGTYTATGSMGFWATINSYGEQQFDVVLANATISPRIRLDTSDIYRYGCGESGSVLLTQIEVPIKWSDMTINFNNLGAFYNSLLNMVGVVLLNTQEKNLVAMAKDRIKEELNSLMC